MKKQSILKKLEEMEVSFLPWVEVEEYLNGIFYDKDGNLQYGDTNCKGKRVLVLGESHYCANETDANLYLTQRVIEDLISPQTLAEWKEKWEYYKNTYTKFERALVGKKVSVGDEKQSLWKHVAFYNYVQRALTGPRKRPTASDFNDSKAAFFAVLDVLEPDFVIAWGKRLYANLPNEGQQGKDIEIEVDGKHYSYETWIYTITSGKQIPVLGIRHPASAFSWKFWIHVIRAFLQSK